ncbi:MAG: hypothetical protein OEW25_01995 [Nitrospira sp.]|nr:hypothetical protein [Nitrospira sp.]MDH4327377.1 hypothetical protein [Nitrospira sp.]MDH5252070.1 hypothetical protein [Nitrospira sp.]
MPQSMIDFGEIAQRAQAGLRDNISIVKLGMQQEQIDNTKAQQLINKQNADTERLNSLHTILKDERFKMDANAEGELMNVMSQIAGGPKIDFKATQMGRQAKIDYFEGMAKGDPEQLERGLKTLAPTMSMEDLTKTIKATAEYGKLNEELLKLKQDREMDASKYEVLQTNNARITYARPLYTEAASAAKFNLRGTTDNHFKKAQGLYETLTKGGGDVSALMSSKPIDGLNKQGFQHLLDGNFGTKALQTNKDLDRIQMDIDSAKKMLVDAESGKPLPRNLTPAMLKAKIETDSVLQESLSSLKEWYVDPFDKGKHERAIQTQQALEKHRLDIEELDKNTHADTIRIQQARLGFDEEKERTKRNLENAETDAQNAFFALPKHKQTPQAAAKISMQIEKSTGVKVKPEDILFKDPNKPLVENKISMTQEKEEAKKVGGGFGEQYSDLQKADMVSRSKVSKYDRMEQLLGQITTGKLEPAKTAIQGLAESLGISVDKTLPTKQAFQALSHEIALTLRNPAGGAGMPGALSDKDREFLQSMTPDLTKTAQGNKMIIDTARQLAKREQDVAKMAREYRKAHGQFDEGFFDKLDVFSTANPLFTKPAAAQPNASGKAQPQASGPTLKSLPKGAKQIGTSGGKPVFQTPDGKKFIGD